MFNVKCKIMGDERDISEFNGAQLKMFRIDSIIQGINMCRHTLDVSQWLFYIQDFDMELESVKKKEEKIELSKKLIKLAEKVNAFQLAKQHCKIKGRMTIPSDLIDDLNAYQKELLQIFKSSGLEMKLQGDAMSNFGK